jgi:hypothetical protein
MDAYIMKVQKLENKFLGLEIHHVIRDNNVGVDILSKLGSTRAQVPEGVFLQELKYPSIKTPEQGTTDPDSHEPDREVMMLREDWREPSSTSSRTKKLPMAISERSAATAHC